MNEEALKCMKDTQCFECGGYGHIRPKCPNFIRKRKKGLTTTWSDSKSEGERETANVMMAYFERDVSEDEFHLEEMTREEVMETYNICYHQVGRNVLILNKP